MPGKIMPDKVLWGLLDILELIPDIEDAFDVVAPRIRRFGDRDELRALESLAGNLAEIERLARDARRGDYRQRGKRNAVRS